MMAELVITDLHVEVDGDGDGGPKEILKGVSLTIRSGETHAIMGPNGSGKSTLAYSIAGHPKYAIKSGSVTLDGHDVLAMSALQIDPKFAERNVNEGFSGGERKRHEILQLELLKPKIAILDETDSGLDVDALKVVSEGINRVREANETGLLLITHTTRLLKQIPAQFVHVVVEGRIVAEGGPELAVSIDEAGYEQFVQNEHSVPVGTAWR